VTSLPLPKCRLEDGARARLFVVVNFDCAPTAVRPATADQIALMDYHERITAAKQQKILVLRNAHGRPIPISPDLHTNSALAEIRTGFATAARFCRGDDWSNQPRPAATWANVGDPWPTRCWRSARSGISQNWLDVSRKPYVSPHVLAEEGFVSCHCHVGFS